MRDMARRTDGAAAGFAPKVIVGVDEDVVELEGTPNCSNVHFGHVG